jgi:histidine ammonia-lyase
MNKILYKIVFSSIFFIHAHAQHISLTGQNLTLANIVSVAQEPLQLSITPEAMKAVEQSYTALLKAVQEGTPLYGVNRGVGLNKDKVIFEGDTIDPEVKRLSEQFNKNILYSHSAAVKPELSANIVFSMMLIRLNMMLQGKSGVNPDVVNLLTAFINNRIQPIVPGRGSIGEGDITILSHIGLAMMGQGDVIFNNKRMAAEQALTLCNLKPLVPFAKDALSILSSNAYSLALAVMLLNDLETWLQSSYVIYGLSLEGLNGNIAPLLTQTQKEPAALMRTILQGSSLWKKSPDRELQDPLSFRSFCQVHGTVSEIVDRLKKKLTVLINSSDDNPAVMLDDNNAGVIMPTSNFETINWIIDFESLAVALSHVSHMSVQRMLKLSDERFTHLTRFLAPNNSAIAYGAIQKTFMALDAQIKSLSMPISADFFPVAGDIEDHATNGPLVLQRLYTIVDNLYYIYGMELMHAAQAVDLRKQKDKYYKLGRSTGALYTAYRKKVSFLEADRPLSFDISASYDFIRNYGL